MPYQYFETPIETKVGNPVACPYVTIKNKWINTPVPHAQTLTGQSLDKTCVPNFQDRMLVPGFGLNYNDNGKPVHLNFQEKSDCYIDNQCQHKLEKNYDPYMQD